MIALSLLPLFQWVSDSAAGKYVRKSEMAVPIIGNFHLLGWVVVMGIVIVVNLAVLNVAVKAASPSRISKELWPLFVASLVVVVTTGVLLISSNAISYYYNPILRTKLGLVSGAIVLFSIVHYRLVRSPEKAPSRGLKALAAINLCLWFFTLIAGRVVGLY